MTDLEHVRRGVAIGAILICIGIMLGAFGAHALRDRLSAEMLSVYDRAVYYQVLHAIGILLTAAFVQPKVSKT